MTNKKTLKAKEDKIVKLQAFDSSCFYRKFFLVTMFSTYVFFYQPALDMLELKKIKALIMFLV